MQGVTLRVLSSHVSLMKRLRDKDLGSFLQGLHRVVGETNVAAVVLRDLTHQTMEGPLGEEQVRGPGELADLALGDGAASPSVCVCVCVCVYVINTP